MLHLNKWTQKQIILGLHTEYKKLCFIFTYKQPHQSKVQPPHIYNRKYSSLPPTRNVNNKSNPSDNNLNIPWVKLKYTSNQPTIYPSMIHSHNAEVGDMVTIYDKGKVYFSI
jgi:hypothetical protein